MASTTIVNQVCGDDYTQACTIEFIYHGNGGTFTVTGQAVLYQVQYSEGGDVGSEAWTDEIHLNPGAGSIDKGAIGVRFRNAVAGSQATVSANINPPNRPGLSISSSAAASGATNIVPTPLASFPPSNPSDGDIIALELPSTYDPVGGKTIRWLFSYNASNAVWDFMGGPALYAEVLTSETLPAAQAAYGDLPTSGPTILLPRSGDYEITPGGGCTGPPSNGVGAQMMAYSIGGGGASDNDASGLPYSGPGVASNLNSAIMSGPRNREKTGLTGGQSVVSKYRIFNGNQASTLGFRWLTIIPVRIT